VQQALVPSFLMQPLLENAIIHGLRGVRKTGIVVVRAAKEEDGLAVTVTVNGIGPPADRAK
jgi:sensor histidine kinase YesM